MESHVSKLIEEDLIIKQVEKICSSNDFKTKELLCRFLSYIVSEYLAGRDQNLKGYNIGIDVFNRDESFDPGQDALVRIHAGRLRRLLDMYYLKEGKNDDIRIEIPKGAYTPKIFPKNQEESKERNIRNENRFNPAADAKVAVLHFKNLAGDNEFNYLAIGISEELSIELTKFEDLSVYNYTHLDNSNWTDLSFKDHLRQKGVRFLVGGALNIIGEQAKLLVHLTDLKEGKQIWGDIFLIDLTIENLFQFQEKVTQEIAIQLGSEYGIILQKLAFDSRLSEFQSFNTYSAMLKYYYFEVNQTEESAIEAFNILNRALDNEPDSGIALALLAAMHGNRYVLDFPDAKESYHRFGTLVEKASKLSPGSLIVKTVNAFKCFVYNDKECFFDLAEKCLATTKNSSLRTGALAFYLSLYGEWERGKQLLDKLMQQNIGYPLYFHASTMLYYYRKKDYKKALEEARKYNMPSIFWAPLLRTAVFGQLNLKTEAQANIKHLLQLKPDFENKAKYLISIFVKEEKLVNHIIEGLQKAGMNL